MSAAALQQMQGRPQLATVITCNSLLLFVTKSVILSQNCSCNFFFFSWLFQDIKGEVNLGGTQKSLPMDPSSIYGQAILQSKSGLGGAGNTI